MYNNTYPYIYIEINTKKIKHYKASVYLCFNPPLITKINKKAEDRAPSFPYIKSTFY